MKFFCIFCARFKMMYLILVIKKAMLISHAIFFFSQFSPGLVSTGEHNFGPGAYYNSSRASGNFLLMNSTLSVAEGIKNGGFKHCVCVCVYRLRPHWIPCISAARSVPLHSKLHFIHRWADRRGADPGGHSKQSEWPRWGRSARRLVYEDCADVLIWFRIVGQADQREAPPPYGFREEDRREEVRQRRLRRFEHWAAENWGAKSSGDREPDWEGEIKPPGVNKTSYQKMNAWTEIWSFSVFLPFLASPRIIFEAVHLQTSPRCLSYFCDSLSENVLHIYIYIYFF